MQFKSSITIEKQKEQVWSFFANPLTNLPKWDRSVEEVIPISTGPIEVGYRFDTISPLKKGQKERKRLKYKLIELIPNQYAKLELLDSPMFKNAIWTTSIESASSNTIVRVSVDITIRAKYFFLIPVLLFVNKKALATDLIYLRKAIDNM